MSDFNNKEPDKNWEITCHYDDSDNSLTLKECLALFELSIKYGLYSDYNNKSKKEP